MHEHHADSSSCTGDCGHCAIGEKAGSTPGPLTGWSMAGAAAMFFGLPLVGAVIGAAVFGSTATGQLIGGVAGLVGGAVIGCAAGRIINRKCEACHS